MAKFQWWDGRVREITLPALVCTKGNGAWGSPRRTCCRKPEFRSEGSWREGHNSRKQWQCPAHEASAPLSPKEELLVTAGEDSQWTEWTFINTAFDAFSPLQPACVRIFTQPHTHQHILLHHLPKQKPWKYLKIVPHTLLCPSCPTVITAARQGLRHSGRKLCWAQTSLWKNERARTALTNVPKALLLQGLPEQKSLAPLNYTTITVNIP